MPFCAEHLEERKGTPGFTMKACTPSVPSVPLRADYFNLAFLQFEATRRPAPSGVRRGKLVQDSFPCSHYREPEKFQNRADFLGTIGAATSQHELYDKFRHSAFSHLAMVMLSWLGGRRVLFDICELLRKRPQTGRCPRCRSSNESNPCARTNRIDRRSLCVARFLIDSIGFAGAFRNGHRTCRFLREIHATAFAHVAAAISF